MNKIYIVKSSHGEYEDYREYNERAFTRKEDAEAYAQQLDSEHKYKPQFITHEFEEAYDQVYEEMDCKVDSDEYLTELFEKCGKDTEATQKYQDFETNFMIDGLYKRGFMVTPEMLKEYDRWEIDRYTEWYDCDIEEIDLVS